MQATPPGSTRATPEDVPPEGVRGSRARKVRRIVRWLVWAGLALLAVGFVAALLAQGASVIATAALSAGLLVEASGLLAYRVLFWSSVYAKDRTKTAHRIRKPGS